MPSPKDPIKRKEWLDKLSSIGSKRQWTQQERKKMSISAKKRFETESAWNKGKKSPKITGDKHPMWEGGRTTNADGYILIYKPNYPYHNRYQYVFEHRYIMEQHLGRLLTKNERVHHINGIRDDNRIENLKIMTNSKHISFHTQKKLKDGTHNLLGKHPWPCNKGKTYKLK